MQIQPNKRLTFIILIILAFISCKKQSQDEERNLNTESYFEDAIKWNPTENSWETFNWLNANTFFGIFKVYINVHDASLDRPKGFKYNDALQGLNNAVSIWKNAIEELGYPCEIEVYHESLGDDMFEWYPRIDVWFVESIDQGKTRGSVTVDFKINGSGGRKEFIDVDMRVAANINDSQGWREMNHDDYMTTLAHEMGHALGIYKIGSDGGHSKNPNDVMYSPSTYWSLSEGDKSTLKRLLETPVYFTPIQADLQLLHIYNDSSCPNAITFRVNSNTYTIQPGELLDIGMPNVYDPRVYIWEYIGNNGSWDGPYIVQDFKEVEIYDASSQQWDFGLRYR